MSKFPNVLKLALEGNIGTGKSTLLDILKSKVNDIQVISEPFTNLKVNCSSKKLELEGSELLKKFYENPQKYAYKFECFTAKCRINDALKYSESFYKSPTVQLYERSIYSSQHVFAKNSFESGLMSIDEWNQYKSFISKEIHSNKALKFDGIVYLRADPKISYQRMIRRGRPEESGLSIEYIKSIHLKHEDWLMTETDGYEKYHGIPILVLDCNTDFQFNPSKKLEFSNRVKQFIDDIKQATIINNVI